jgi:uncharacterized membrane protein
MATVPKSSSRLAYLDWTRGLAALIMLQGHVFHSFTRPDLRQDSPYVLSQFVGGMPPAVFLFLTGVTLAFLMESRERQGHSAGARIMAALRRAGYLLGLAFLFRLQLWAFALPAGSWTDLFRVDILNCMGLSIAVLSLAAVFRTEQRVRICAALGVLIAIAAPLVSHFTWPGVPPFLRAYFVPDTQFFAFFPWAAFVAFGMSAGSILRVMRKDLMDRFMQWSAVVGFALILGAQYAANLPYSLYPTSDFWLNSPTLILIKLGVILLMLTGAYLWTQYGAAPGWSWVRQFGTTSLLVYWVHTELVYGRWLWFWKESLTAGQAAAAAIGVILLMLALSALRTNWNNLRGLRLSYYYPYFVPGRVSGD